MKESNIEIKGNWVTIFKITSFLEGLSYVLLLFIAVPVKYFWDNAAMVKMLGMPHGILFIGYIAIALIIKNSQNWNSRDTFLVLLASLIPFGTFYVVRKYFP